MSYDRAEKIRRAAILVASLNDEMAEQLLDSLPPQEATRVLAEVDRLEEIDPEEQRDVLDEFRRVTRGGKTAADAVEFTYSVPQAAVARAIESAAATAPEAQSVVHEPLAPVDADVPLVVEVLREEQPQTIATALSRMDQDRAAAVFAALPAYLQVEVLDRIANLQVADEAAVQEVEAQLQRRIEQQRERRHRAAASIELARRIVAQTSPADQTVLLARLPASHARSTTTVPASASEADRMAQQAANLAFAGRLAQHMAPGWDGVSTNWSTDADEDSNGQRPSPMVDAPVLEDRSRELEALSDRELLTGLKTADERTVQRALAASSETFLRRVCKKLPRQQSRRLRQMVRSLGPTRIADMRLAQYEFLALAQSGTAQAA